VSTLTDLKVRLGEWARPDGGLYYSGGQYLNWEIGDERAVLDGDFTAQELSDIAEWMLLHPETP
jgi:hypothetical protein